MESKRMFALTFVSRRALNMLPPMPLLDADM